MNFFCSQFFLHISIFLLQNDLRPNGSVELMQQRLVNYSAMEDIQLLLIWVMSIIKNEEAEMICRKVISEKAQHCVNVRSIQLHNFMRNAHAFVDRLNFIIWICWWLLSKKKNQKLTYFLHNQRGQHNITVLVVFPICSKQNNNNHSNVQIEGRQVRATIEKRKKKLQ